VAGCPVVGDSTSDIEAAIAAGARPIRVKTGKPAGKLKSSADIETFTDLATAARALISEQGNQKRVRRTAR